MLSAQMLSAQPFTIIVNFRLSIRNYDYSQLSIRDYDHSNANGHSHKSPLRATASLYALIF